MAFDAPAGSEVSSTEDWRTMRELPALIVIVGAIFTPRLLRLTFPT
jgi:hypothetical protein